MPLITKQQILSVRDLPFEDVPVPEWGEGAEVRITTMSGIQKDDWESTVFAVGPDGKTAELNKQNFTANLLARTIVDEAGNRIFSTAEEVLLLGEKSGKVLARLYQVAKRLNSIGVDEEEKVEKN
jgi:hypothetical protein